MDWSLRLSDTPLHIVQLLDGDPPLLCAWTTRDIVYFYAQDDGAYYGGLDISNAPDDQRGAAWRDYLEGLRAPNGAYLPLVDLGHTVVLTSRDGRLRLYQREHQLTLDVDRQQTVLELEEDAALLSVELDRELGTIGALGNNDRLHVYQQYLYLGAYPVEHGAKKIYVPDESGSVVVVSEQRIQIFDTAGHVQRTVETINSTSACTPDGSRMLTADQEQGLLKVYNANLRLLRQQSSHTLLKWSTPIDDWMENVAFLPTSPESLALSNAGRLAFALGGLLCCTHLNRMAALPQPRILF